MELLPAAEQGGAEFVEIPNGELETEAQVSRECDQGATEKYRRAEPAPLRFKIFRQARRGRAWSL